jgi:hypothetical protein
VSLPAIVEVNFLLLAKEGEGQHARLIGGFLRAAETDKIIKGANASAGYSITALTYLAGPRYASSTREGIEKAISTLGQSVEPRKR